LRIDGPSSWLPARHHLLEQARLKMIFEHLPLPARRSLFALFLKSKGVEFRRPISILGRLPLIHGTGLLQIGKDTTFDSRLCPHQIRVSDGAILKIGQGVYLNEGVDIAAYLHIEIGDYTRLAPHVCIMDYDFHEITPDRPARKEPIRIGYNVWIGTKCVILRGSSIGDHAIIGAGSVVKGHIPDRCVATGNPARVVRRFQAHDRWVRT
jgi:acetyltransferase-like isoleucine patch superfamily enzyme